MNTKTINIGKDWLQIWDGVFTNAEIEECYEYFKGLAFLKQERDNPEDLYPSFSADLKPKNFEIKHALGIKSRTWIDNISNHASYVLFRVAVNLMTKGDMELPHTDCPKDRGDITVLFYLNNKWLHTWGGETLFYSANEAVYAVLPKPGRVVIFSGSITHKAGIPNSLAKDVRYTLALKYALREKIVIRNRNNDSSSEGN